MMPMSVKTNRGPPTKGMLRDSYVDGVLDGMLASETQMSTVRSLVEFLCNTAFDQKTMAKVLDIIDRAIEFAKHQAMGSGIVTIDPDELRIAKERRSITTGGAGG